MLDSCIFRSVEVRQIFNWQPLLKLKKNPTIIGEWSKIGGTKICLGPRRRVEHFSVFL